MPPSAGCRRCSRRWRPLFRDRLRSLTQDGTACGTVALEPEVVFGTGYGTISPLRRATVRGGYRSPWRNGSPRGIQIFAEEWIEPWKGTTAASETVEGWLLRRQQQVCEQAFRNKLPALRHLDVTQGHLPTLLDDPRPGAQVARASHRRPQEVQLELDTGHPAIGRKASVEEIRAGRVGERREQSAVNPPIHLERGGQNGSGQLDLRLALVKEPIPQVADDLYAGSEPLEAPLDGLSGLADRWIAAGGWSLVADRPLAQYAASSAIPSAISSTWGRMASSSRGA